MYFPSKPLSALCITHMFPLQRLRTENLLLRQKMDMLEQESSDLADRLIQVRVNCLLIVSFGILLGLSTITILLSTSDPANKRMKAWDT